MRVPREDIKGWFQNKTDGGKVTRTKTYTTTYKAYDSDFEGGKAYGIDLAKDLMYHVYGLEPDSSTWDGLGKRGRDE